MKQTTKYQLNLMESGDAFSPDPINENTQALENALVEHNSDENAHSALRTTVAEHTADKDNPHAVTAAQVGAAAASHNHSAAAITSGTLPVSRGGTGYTSVDSTPTGGSKKMVTSGGVYTALEGKAAASHSHSEYAAASHSHSGYAAASHSHSGYAAASHSHGAGSITSGTLPVSRGGTGKASYTANRLIYPSAATTLAQLAFPSAAGSVLRQGTSGAPYWTSPADLASTLGVLSVMSGTYTGDGQTTNRTISLGKQPKLVIICCKHSASGYEPPNIVISTGETAYVMGCEYRREFRSDLVSFHTTGFTLTGNEANQKYMLNVASQAYLYYAIC